MLGDVRDPSSSLAMLNAVQAARLARASTTSHRHRWGVTGALPPSVRVWISISGPIVRSFWAGSPTGETSTPTHAAAGPARHMLTQANIAKFLGPARVDPTADATIAPASAAQPASVASNAKVRAGGHGVTNRSGHTTTCTSASRTTRSNSVCRIDSGIRDWLRRSTGQPIISPIATHMSISRTPGV